MFTRLSIANCGHDLGVRPLTCGCPGYLSPAFDFSQYPIPALEPTKIRIGIKNLGTMDASTVTLEVAYNLWIGNDPEGMVTFSTALLPVIPVQGFQTAEVNWTPPDTESTHACLHARVIDLYSLMYHSERNTSWDSYVNPQAGNRNVTLVPIQDETRSIAVHYAAKNWTKNFKTKIRVLVSEHTSRPDVKPPAALFPLPFVPDKYFAAAHTTRISEAAGLIRACNTIGGRNFMIGGMALPQIVPDELWPVQTVASEFIHKRFGFDADGRLPDAAGAGVRRGFTSFETKRLLPLRSLHGFSLKPGEERLLHLVIPPDQFPAPGRRKVFRVQYQVGTDRPVDHFVYLSR